METKKTETKKRNTKKSEPAKAKATTKATAAKKKVEPVVEPVVEPAVEASDAPVKKQEGKMYVVSVKTKLNVRKGAGFSYPVVKQLKDGDRVIITSEEDGWCKIDDGEWVCRDYLK